MNLVKLVHNPYTNELKVYINDALLSGYSAINKYLNKPFDTWCEVILDEIYREVNDDFSLIFCSSKLECEIMRKLASQCNKCVDFETQDFEVNESTLERLLSLQAIGGDLLDKDQIKIKLFSYEDGLCESVEEVLLESGMFEQEDEYLVCKDCPMCEIRLDKEYFDNANGSICVFVTQSPLNNDVISKLKAFDFPIFILKIGIETLFQRKEKNLYYYNFDGYDIADLLMSFIEGMCLNPLVKEAQIKLLSNDNNSLTENERTLIEGITLVQSSYIINCPAVLHKKRKYQITVCSLPHNLDNINYKYECSNDEILSMEDSEITCKNEGNATIFAYLENSRECIVSIDLVVKDSKIITKLALFPQNKFMSNHKTEKLDVKFEPSDAENADEIRYKSDNDEVAAIDEAGYICAKSIGSCNITAFTPETEATIRLDVQPHIEDIVLPSYQMELTVGDKVEYNFSVVPENCFEREFIKVWCNDESVAAYRNGYIIGNKPGETSITVYTDDNSMKRSCSIRVKKGGFFR